ncbi:hypothetical protein [Schlesneria paludicola]|uniref:hypothetical protein n=1 Tax=Schlesneria paludicola TaxID=360056 RepID=UPI00029B2C74|nr:hypothetical protein [Schlesneria paludicola]
MLHSKISRLLLLVPFLLASCSEKGPKAPVTPKTTSVGGTVMIDGDPAPKGQIEMKLYVKGAEVKPGELVANCLIGEGGKYRFSSYREGDGAVPGDYVISMEWLRPAPGVMYGPDKFLNNFNSPLNTDSRFQVTVVDGQPVEVPTIEIDTRELKQKPSHPYATPSGKQQKKK